MTSAADRVVLVDSWKNVLVDQFESSYMQKLRDFLLAERSAGYVVYPRGSEIFRALDLCPLESVRVVIIGQDPYHGPGQAHGLCFSVPSGVALPPSLVNILTEIREDITEQDETAIPRDVRGCLVPWAEQGVLLLNSVLTVRRGQASSHEGRGWEQFTDRIVEIVNERCEHVVFLLWGNYARRKAAFVDTHRHCVLVAPHPSPLSANRGFFGCRHFSKANAYLTNHGHQPINWLKVA